MSSINHISANNRLDQVASLKSAVLAQQVNKQPTSSEARVVDKVVINNPNVPDNLDDIIAPEARNQLAPFNILLTDSRPSIVQNITVVVKNDVQNIQQNNQLDFSQLDYNQTNQTFIQQQQLLNRALINLFSKLLNLLNSILQSKNNQYSSSLYNSSTSGAGGLTLSDLLLNSIASGGVTSSGLTSDGLTSSNQLDLIESLLGMNSQNNTNTLNTNNISNTINKTITVPDSVKYMVLSAYNNASNNYM